ncbi:MAG: O-antigen ligase family protein [Cyclobacteriaceae bacterium]|nr:O-antigen ligase family protein [Cyclobacteriaceae bacterium]
MLQDSVNMDIKRNDVVLTLALGALLFSAFTSGLSVDIGPVTITLSHVCMLLLIGHALLYAAMSRYRVPVLYRDDVSFLLYLFVLSNLFSSTLFAANRFYSLKACGPLVAGVLMYTAARTGIRMLRDLNGSISKFTFFNQVSAAFGLVCMLLAMITGVENRGVSFDHLAIGMSTLGGLVPPSIQGLAVEPNLFSIGTAAVLCLPLGRYLLGERRQHALTWILIMGFSILFAYTRSVYGAMVVVMVVLMVLAKQTTVIKRVVLFGTITLAIVLVIGWTLPADHPARKAFEERIATLVDFKGGTGGGRVQGYLLAWESFLDRPILGKGTLSADTEVYNPYVGQYQERMGGRGWLTGSGIQALHDTGIVGFVILMSLFGLTLWKNFKAFKQLPPGDWHRGIALGFLGGNLVILITSQLSSPLWTAFPYIFWAVNMEFLAACKVKINSPALKAAP